MPSLGDGSTVRDSLGHLISIHSQAEQDFAITLYETSRKKEVDAQAVSNLANLLLILSASSFSYMDNLSTPVRLVLRVKLKMECILWKSNYCMQRMFLFVFAGFFFSLQHDARSHFLYSNI